MEKRNNVTNIYHKLNYQSIVQFDASNFVMQTSIFWTCNICEHLTGVLKCRTFVVQQKCFNIPLRPSFV